MHKLLLSMISEAPFNNSSNNLSLCFRSLPEFATKIRWKLDLVTLLQFFVGQNLCIIAHFNL